MQSRRNSSFSLYVLGIVIVMAFLVPNASADNEPGEPVIGEPGFDYPACQVCLTTITILPDYTIVKAYQCADYNDLTPRTQGRECQATPFGCQIHDFCVWA